MAASDAGKKANPALSFNPRITAPEDAIWGETPSAEALEQMKRQDPPLQYSWCIWEQYAQTKEKADKYADATKMSISFSTVKEFWAIWNHLPQPSELLDGRRWMREQDGNRTIVDSLMVFKKGVRPEWEDPSNARGGHFQLLLPPKLGGALVDELWNSVVLGMIGGAIEPADMITGVRIVDKLNQKMKPGLRIELWFNEHEEGSEKLYKLRGSFEQSLRTNLDGSEKAVSWGYTETKSHAKK
jgi:translation initiation factor 4E